MRDELRAMALCALVIFVMYMVGEGIIEMGKAIISAFAG